ncbi:SPOSA6832_02476 [Sporobolomyces salmonicolor]|uniref:SPOSA6832_02476-mRNA-1:cds n=1 Tax=Sporidiobolus salmonicolor TaxID=5005 RepID=A0A0D6ELG3_SPOSA|nr:SPOSA6832_02476 [Sporobolomyces salmonicolor]
MRIQSPTPSSSEFKTPPLPSSRPSSSQPHPRASSVSSSRPPSRSLSRSTNHPPPSPAPSTSVRRPSSVLASANPFPTETRSQSPVKPSSRASIARPSLGGGVADRRTSTVSTASSSSSVSTSFRSAPLPSSSSAARAAQTPGTRSVIPPPTPRGVAPPSSASSSSRPGTGLSRPISPRKPPTGAANFAPPNPISTPAGRRTDATLRASRTPGLGIAGVSGPGTAGRLGEGGAAETGSRTPGASTGNAGALAMKRQLSGGSAASASSSSSAGAGMGALRRPVGAAMGRQMSGLSAGSRAEAEDRELEAQGQGEGEGEEEEEPEEWLQETEPELPGGRAVSPVKNPSSASGMVPPQAEEKDPFSLRNTDRGKLAEAMVPKRDYDELFAKLSILERRRTEDREKIREVERLKEEEQEWNRMKERTKGRLAELAAECKELRRENKDLTLDRDAFSSKFEDLQEEVEHSVLDKEIAESELDEARAQVKLLEERCAELEVEVGVFREENARLEGPPIDTDASQEGAATEGGAGALSSLAYRQLEKQNLRLKDALVRLRDLTAETEAEAKRRIESLEKELDLSTDLQSDLDNMAVELDEAEAKIEDLKAQLDVAAEAQDMLEELTERNLKLHDDNEALKGEVEELEALRELADELEESHIETEKQLQEELDLKDLQLQELRRRNESLEDSCADYEGTIGQFRELVISLQGDLEDLRHHQATQATESQSLSSQSQAMLNLNLKLQSSVLKSQVKAIDLELRKLEAQQAAEHLAMVKPYLIPAFFESDADAVDSLLFFERLAYKADLLSMFIEQNHSVNDALDGVVPEDLVGVCETRAKLGQYAAINKRFAAHLQRCPPEVFLKMGRVYRELVGNEKRLDGFVEALRREELKIVECGKELDGCVAARSALTSRFRCKMLMMMVERRFVAQAEHLADAHLEGLDPTLDLAEREVAFVTVLDLDFDTIAAAAGFVKQTVATISRDPADVELELGDANIDDSLFKPLQNVVNHARNAKVLTKKLLRRFDDLAASSSALNLDHAQGFETLAYNSTAIASAVSKVRSSLRHVSSSQQASSLILHLDLQLASDISHYCAEVRSSKQPLQLSTIATIAKEIAAVELGKQSPRPLEEINALLVQLAQDVGTTLTTAMDGEHVVKLSYEPPWTARVAELHSNAAINVDAARKVVQLNEEMRDLVREMRTKEQVHQESAVKIELMEKRMEAVKKQADALAQLEAELAKSRKQERTYEEANEVLQRDLDTMEQELAKLRQTAAAAEKQTGTAQSAANEGDSVAYEGNMETAYLVEQITSLRSAVRFLRSENSYLKSQDLLADLDSLPSYALPPTPPFTPEPSSDEDDSVPSPPLSRLSKKLATLPAESFATQSQQLLREARLVSATPRLVDLSQIAPLGAKGKRGWQPAQRDPRNQLWAEKERARELERKVKLLWDARPAAARARGRRGWDGVDA